MSIYLKDIPLPKAQKILEESLKKAGLHQVLEQETIHLNIQAYGRVLTEPIWARISSPHYHAAAKDGFAVRANETEEDSETNPVVLYLPRQAAYIDTGDPLQENFNAVIPIENVEPLDKNLQIT